MTTEKEQAQIKADAKKRAAGQKAAVQAQEEHVEAFREDAEEGARGKQAIQEMPATPAYDDALIEYGPYPDTMPMITTPEGEYGVAYGYVLFFEEVEIFDNRVNRMVKVRKDFRRKATSEEMAPIRAKRAAKKAALAGRT
jgi:hypothetical protein